MIMKVSTKDYRNQQFDCFWLTPDGTLCALLEGANQLTLYEKSIKVYPENENLHCLLEVTPFLGTDFLKIALGAFLAKGKIDNDDITMILATQMNRELTDKQGRQLAAVLKKYPDQYKRLNDTTKRIRQALNKLEYDFSSET